MTDSSSTSMTTPPDLKTEDLVPHWLTEANLEYAIPNFEMAGIVSPRSFVELELSYFEPLGVIKADDRKKLFYLIQGVKKGIEKEDRERKMRKAREGNVGAGGGGVSRPRPRQKGGESKRGEDHDDEYADEEFQSPPNSKANGGYNNEGGRMMGNNDNKNNNYSAYQKHVEQGDNQEDMMSTVEIHRRHKSMDPISPVTISSPIASVAEDHVGPIGIGSRAAIKSLALGGGSSNAGEEVATATGNNHIGRKQQQLSVSTGTSSSSRQQHSNLTPREKLERELEQRAMKRREQKIMTRKKDLLDESRDISYQDDFELEDEDHIIAKKKKDKLKSNRRQSFLPSVQASGSSVSSRASASSRRRSSIASYRPSVSTTSAAAKKKGTFDALSYVDDLEEECKSSYNADDQLDDAITTPKSIASVDVRSRRSSIHHRQTVKKTNATKAGGTRAKNRRYSSIPRANVAAPLFEDDDDDDEETVLSDTSDLSTSVTSYRSLASSASSVGTAHSSRSGLSSALGGTNSTDENQNYGNVERKINRRKSQIKGVVGASIGGSSIASLRGGKKRLSTIPSSKIAPLSPLAGLSSMQLDETMASHSRKTGVAAAAGPRNPLRRRSSLGSGRSVSSRPGTADSAGSKKKRSGGGGDLLAKSRAAGLSDIGGGGVGSPSSTASSISYRSRPSSRGSLDGSQQQLLRKNKLNVSSSSNKTNGSGMSSASSVQRRRQRLESPTPRTNVPRSKSPVPPPSRGGSVRSQKSPLRSPTRARTPPSRAVSPKRTQRAQSPKLGVVGNRPLSPIRSPTRSRATSPKSPRRVKSPVSGSGAIFVHGGEIAESWSTQVGQLREAFDVEHAKRMEGRYPNQEDDEYEMRIRVIVRIRPMSKFEASDGSEMDVMQPLEYEDYGRILAHKPKTQLDLTKEIETTSFAFDNVFDEHSNNVLIYERAVQSLIPGVFRGKWASVFAYGQTGSGKTFTMMGSNATGSKAGNQAENSISEANRGLYFLAAEDVFRIAEDPAYADISIGVSLFEIYGGKLLDLLNARNPVRCLEDRKGKVCFPGLSEHPVNSATELMEIIDAGAMNRSTGTTSANADSSRSHAVLQLSLRKDVGRAKNKEYGRLTFIDLAGSERGADTSKACRTTRMEGAEINTSLLALKEVIRALATGSSLKRIPFRGSKLTQVLKDSFVGKNCRTVMVSCVAPNHKNCDHTLNTLRYADRVKERDAQTGELSASVAASSKIKRDQADNIVRVRLPPRPLTAPAASFRIEREDESDDDDIPPPPSHEDLLLLSLDEGVEFVEDDDEYSDNASKKSGYSELSYDKLVESVERDSLEGDSLSEALKSHDNLPIPFQESATRPQTLKDNPAAQSLIATHKSIMSKLLQMLQHEMALVNNTDAHRDNIDEYLQELEKLSEQQVSLLSTLRESLVSYNESKNSFGNITHASNDTVDDSFDLVRD